MADELENTPCALMGEAMARYKHDEITAGEAVSIILEQAKRLSQAPMEAVAWREKLKGPAAWLNRWAAHVRGCRGGQVCTCGLTMAQFEIEQALALIATHPVQGGEG